LYLWRSSLLDASARSIGAYIYLQEGDWDKIKSQMIRG
jgi:hypothetical protein